MIQSTKRRKLLAGALVGVGLVTTIVGLRLIGNPRSDLEEHAALYVFAAGMCSIGAGVSLPFARPIVVILAAIASPAVGWCLLMFAYFVALDLSRWPSQEQMVPSGYRMITEARQIDDLLGRARHQISNYQEPDIAEWQTDALFGGRYELLMTVGVRVDRRSGRVTEVLGAPRFSLMEIEKIQGSQEVMYRPANEHKFGADEWRQVVKAQGDFSVIGIQLDRTNPVPGFDSAQGLAPNGMRMHAALNH
jgi:hypothetical protein